MHRTMIFPQVTVILDLPDEMDRCFLHSYNQFEFNISVHFRASSNPKTTIIDGNGAVCLPRSFVLHLNIFFKVPYGLVQQLPLLLLLEKLEPHCFNARSPTSPYLGNKAFSQCLRNEYSKPHGFIMKAGGNPVVGYRV